MLCVHFILVIGATISGTSSKEISYDCEGVDIATRKDWEARNAMREREMSLPVNHVIILHTDTTFCMKDWHCVREVQTMQNYWLDEKGLWDLGYNFLISGNGRVYEVRGWNLTGAHVPNYNTNSYGIAFIGDFEKDIPTKSMLNSALQLIDCGVKRGYLTPAREIHGHRDCICTESPGKNLYNVIKYWKHFKGGRLPMYVC
nr:peptidoglycan recognition protein-like [Parasteatoda tepidariorum]